MVGDDCVSSSISWIEPTIEIQIKELLHCGTVALQSSNFDTLLPYQNSTGPYSDWAEGLTYELYHKTHFNLRFSMTSNTLYNRVSDCWYYWGGVKKFSYPIQQRFFQIKILNYFSYQLTNNSGLHTHECERMLRKCGAWNCRYVRANKWKGFFIWVFLIRIGRSTA